MISKVEGFDMLWGMNINIGGWRENQDEHRIFCERQL